MNRTFLPILTITAALAFFPCCVSCTEKNQPDNQDSQEQQGQKEPEPVDDGKPKAGEYSFTVSPLKGKWEAGDQIQVHGSYGPAAKTVTLKATDISSDGKTAKVKLEGDLFEYLASPDNLYAAWPASAVQAEDGLTDATTTFTKADILLAQAYLDGTNFTFDDASAAITFTVSGSYDRVLIAGNQRPGLRFQEYSNAHSSAETSFSKVVSDGYPFREVTLAGDGKTTTVWFPGGVTLKGGFTLFFGKNGTWPVAYTRNTEDGLQNGTLKAGKVLELGDITAQLAEYTGPEPKMPEMGKRTKYAIQLNELSGLCLSEDGSFLWGLGDGSEIARISFDGELVSKANLKTTTGSTIDSEAISLKYDTGDLLIGGEPSSVCRIPAAGVGDVFKESTYKGAESLFKIDDAKNFGNAGLEGITYYKNGLAYVGTQTGSYLYLCNLETGEVIWRKGLREMYPAITEIADLCYDPLTDWLWVIDSESLRFFALTGDAESMLGFYSARGISNPESICVDHKNSCIWVGDDYGSTSYLYRFDFTGLDDAVISGK